MLSGFEGQIDLVFKDMSKERGGAAQVVPLSLVIKNEKIRAEMPQAVGSKPMPKGHVVLSAPEKKLSVVMDEQRQIVIVDLNQAGPQLKSFGNGMAGAARDMDKDAKEKRPQKPPPTVTKTGVKDKVAGIVCENWEIADEGRKAATLCIADQGASWLHLPLTGIPTEYAWALELFDGKHFPLRMIGYDKAGAEDGRVELTKLEKKSVSPALFDMPADYKVVDLGAMMAGLGSPGAPGGQFAMPPGWTPQKKHK
jgi:hypothetical protein